MEITTAQDSQFGNPATNSGGGSKEGSDSYSEHGLTCMAWNDCPFEPHKFAVGGYSKRAVILSLDGKNVLREECVLGEHSSPIHDIAWAPSMGRSYHMIATAYREPTFKVHTVSRNADGSLTYVSTQIVESIADEDSPTSSSAGASSSSSSSSISPTPLTSSEGTPAVKMKANIWRVTWNATGTVIATSSDDGTLSLWRKNFAGTWINVQNLPSGVETRLKHFYHHKAY